MLHIDFVEISHQSFENLEILRIKSDKRCFSEQAAEVLFESDSEDAPALHEMIHNIVAKVGGLRYLPIRKLATVILNS